MTQRRVALVTGGSRGIGLGIATALARDGLDLAICGRRPADDVADAMQALRSLGGDVAYVRADIGERTDRAALLESVLERFGRVDVLVNNAGVAPRTRDDMLVATEEEFERSLRINLQGPYFLTQAVAGWMVQHGGASPRCIVNVGSVSATLVSVNRGEYCVSKAGLAMASSLWAVRLAEHGIPVYEVRPGLIHSDMTAGVTAKYDQRIAEGAVPEGRWGEPDDIGRAVAMLVRGDMPYATGSVLTVDGGLTIPRL
jgi:NAD(P)-dependent dehydrogenase (short-subunit alcohol dehydrogenase family)